MVRRHEGSANDEHDAHCRGTTQNGQACQRSLYLNAQGYCPSHARQGPQEDSPENSGTGAAVAVAAAATMAAESASARGGGGSVHTMPRYNPRRQDSSLVFTRLGCNNSESNSSTTGSTTCRGRTLAGRPCQRSQYLNDQGYCPNHANQQQGSGRRRRTGSSQQQRRGSGGGHGHGRRSSRYESDDSQSDDESSDGSY